MKKILIMLVLALITATCFAAGGNDAISCKTVMENVAVAASGSKTSVDIDLNSLKPSGAFSIYVELTGTGTAKIQYQVSSDSGAYGATPVFVTPASAVDIVTAFTVASGTSGKDVIAFEPEGPVTRLRIKVTETGGAAAITIAKLIVCAQ